MSKRMSVSVLEAVGEAAEAVAVLRDQLPDGSRADGITQELKRLAADVAGELAGEGGDAEAPAARPAAEKPAKKPAKAEKAGAGTAAAPERKAVMGVCRGCGKSYLRRGPAQKYCSEACKGAEAAKAKDKPDTPAAPEAPKTRIDQIRAANERLDRIPEKQP